MARLVSRLAALFAIVAVTLVAAVYVALVINITGDIVESAGSETDRKLLDDDDLRPERGKVPLHKILEFDKAAPKTVIILTYQRSGSSFVGDMFNANPAAFYLYEPIDSLYVAMYGMNHGWSVPSDITNYYNGSERIVPEAEVRAVADFLDHFLSCDIEWLPTEALTHNFWRIHHKHFTNLKDYVGCITARNLTYPTCKAENPSTCGERFGKVDDEENSICRQLLWDERYDKSVGSVEQHIARRTAIPDSVRDSYGIYMRCLNRLRQSVDTFCTPILRQVCSGSRLRVVKATRATMRSVALMLQRRPATDRNLRVIHSYRDPRAVAVSRMRQGDPLLGKFASYALKGDGVEEETIVREARMYCRTVAADVRVRRQLEAAYPGRIYTIKYEDVADDVVRYVDEVYRFLNETVPATTRDWVVKAAAKSKMSGRSWRRRMSLTLSDRIVNDECKELCALIGCT
jgi:hypothetical protein